MVAHQLHTVYDASMIYVLKEGKIVEQGNHQELIARGGVYAKYLDFLYLRFLFLSLIFLPIFS
jgi:ATP-binding cassette subfamily B protein